MDTQLVTFPACTHSMERVVHKPDKVHNFFICIRSSENVRQLKSINFLKLQKQASTVCKIKSRTVNAVQWSIIVRSIFIVLCF